MNSVVEAGRLRIGLTKAGLPEGCVVRRIETEKRAIPLSRGYHVRGRHPIRPGHPAVPFESALECSLLSALAPNPDLVRVISQPVTMFYTEDGVSRRYTPDFLVEFRRLTTTLSRLGFGLRTMVEVKPLQLALREPEELCKRLRLLRFASGESVTLITESDVNLIVEGVRHDA